MPCRALATGCWLLCLAITATSPRLSPYPPHHKLTHPSGRSFLGLDKCDACAGTSICKKFFKDEIRFMKAPVPHQPAAGSGFLANYMDGIDSWRLVGVSRLLSQQQHEQSDLSICTSAHREDSCSIEVVLRTTQRFKSLAQSNLLLPHMVQGLTTPMLRCPSQRLLNRIIRRYAEVSDAGSVQMKHFSNRDKLRLLYTLSVNQHPLILQMFPGAEGWPFPRYHGACGRMVVWASGRPIAQAYNATLETRVDIGCQLLHITMSLASNSLRFHLYYTGLTEDMFSTGEDGKLFIANSSTIGIIDQQEGIPPEVDAGSVHRDVFSCLGGSCERPPPCSSIRPSHSLALVCRHLLPRLLRSTDALPSNTSALLGVCADPRQTDGAVHAAAQGLLELLKGRRVCSRSFPYRYPECRYNRDL